MIKNLKKIITLCHDLKLKFIWIQFLIISYGSFQIFNLLLFKPYIDSILNNETSIKLNFIFFNINSISFVSLTILFITSFVITSILSVYALKETIVFSQTIGKKLKELIYQNNINQKYQNYIGNSSVDIQTLISIEIVRATGQIIQPLIFILYRLIPVMFIVIFLFTLSTQITILIFSLLFFLVFILLLFFKIKLINVDNVIRITNHNISKNVLETFKNIKQVKIFKLEKYFYKAFKIPIEKLVYAIPTSRVIELSIKSIIEIFFMLSVAVLLFFRSNISLMIENISIIITYIFAIYRILPGIQTIYASYISVTANVKSLNFLNFIDEDTIKKHSNFELEINTNNNSSQINLNLNEIKIDSIEIKNLSYKYDKIKVFENKNFKFSKSNVYLIKGESGVGKTTLMDILAGLVRPNSGDFLINNKSISSYEYSGILKYVSSCTQNTALFNSSILENITFEKDIENVNLEKLRDSLEISGLNKIIKILPNKYNEIINENGENFSGGQIQRIGISRCLYKDFSILILDEPTSALDSVSEKKIFEQIIDFYKNKEKMIFIISHSNDLDKFADEIINL